MFYSRTWLESSHFFALKPFFKPAIFLLKPFSWQSHFLAEPFSWMAFCGVAQVMIQPQIVPLISKVQMKQNHHHHNQLSPITVNHSPTMYTTNPIAHTRTNAFYSSFTTESTTNTFTNNTSFNPTRYSGNETNAYYGTRYGGYHNGS